jgi:hypothetical protein
MADDRNVETLARPEMAERVVDRLGTEAADLPSRGRAIAATRRLARQRVPMAPLMAVCLAAALIGMAGAMQAQSAAVQPVALTANVDAYCTIDGATASASRIVTVTTSSGKVATPGPVTLTPSTSSRVICTSNARIQLTTANGGLTNGPIPQDATYTNKIHYTAKATYAGTTETLTTTDATPAGFQTTGRTTGGGARTNIDLDIAVEVLATPAGKFLVRGTYTDTIMVTLTPTT